MEPKHCPAVGALPFSGATDEFLEALVLLLPLKRQYAGPASRTKPPSNPNTINAALMPAPDTREIADIAIEGGTSGGLRGGGREGGGAGGDSGSVDVGGPIGGGGDGGRDGDGGGDGGGGEGGGARGGGLGGGGAGGGEATTHEPSSTVATEL